MAADRRRFRLAVALPPRGKRLDPDNHLKLLLDSLVRAGLLKDDSAAMLPALPEVEYTRGTAGEWGTQIILQDVEL